MSRPVSRKAVGSIVVASPLLLEATAPSVDRPNYTMGSPINAASKSATTGEAKVPLVRIFWRWPGARVIGRLRLLVLRTFVELEFIDKGCGLITMGCNLNQRRLGGVQHAPTLVSSDDATDGTMGNS